MLAKCFVAALVATSALTVSAQQQQQQQNPLRPVNPRSFATKTAYWDQRNADDYDVDVLRAKAQAQVERQNLTLVQVQQINRHGTRFPTKSNTQEIIDLLTKLQTNYSSAIPAWLRNYSLPYNLTIEGNLAPAGAQELFKLGGRTRDTVGTDLPTEYVADKFIFQHTYKLRTKDSATSFAKSFFTNPQDVKYIEYPKTGDRLLRYFDECPRYNSEVAENETALAELTAYKASKKMDANIAILKSKLNLDSSADITAVDVESAFSACAFDIAIYNTYTNWCTLVTKSFVDSLDYAEDMESFYEQGAGYKINYEIAAVLLKDVFKYITDFIAGTTPVVGNFRFAHAETTLPLMTLLGYGDRTPLLATYTADQVDQRGFRTSRLSPLAANLDFRLYQSKTNSSAYFVQVLVNEKTAALPGCDGKVFCELAQVEQAWGYYLNTYDFDADCKV
uniref:Multiple inositol polyphosphate phosphatase 1 n=1 Tax=Globisporangium ultimum (strain ATCC 200006 / CBS 805.95 / DAOM BR144) TaxID=431595 RepID=K3WU65_GLOUD